MNFGDTKSPQEDETVEAQEAIFSRILWWIIVIEWWAKKHQKHGEMVISPAIFNGILWRYWEQLANFFLNDGSVWNGYSQSTGNMG